MILQCSICPVGSSKLELLWAPSRYLGIFLTLKKHHKKHDYLIRSSRKTIITSPPPQKKRHKLLSQIMSSLHRWNHGMNQLKFESRFGLSCSTDGRWPTVWPFWGLCSLDGRFIIWIFSRAGREVGQHQPQKSRTLNMLGFFLCSQNEHLSLVFGWVWFKGRSFVRI